MLLKTNSPENIVYLVVAFVILILALLSVAATYLIYSNKRLSSEEFEKKSLREKLKKFEREIVNKQKLINSFDEDKESSKFIQSLKNSSITSNKDWLSFESLFDNVYKGFLYRFNQKFSRASFTERKILVLARMDLSYKEMSLILGISANSPRVTWYRFRKKYNIDDVSIYNFVKTI